MRHFETGAVRDDEDGKLDFVEPVSWTAFARYVKYMTEKKKKYGQGNFKKGIPIDAYERSLLRHIHKYLVNKYEGGNEEKDQDHLSAIIFNTLGIIHEQEMEKIKNKK